MTNDDGEMCVGILGIPNDHGLMTNDGAGCALVSVFPMTNDQSLMTRRTCDRKKLTLQNGLQLKGTRASARPLYFDHYNLISLAF
jgi:hypothetical protein